MGYSSLVNKFIPAYEGNYTKNRKAWGHNKISEICIHYIAGDITIESLGNIWQTPGRNGSSTYGIGSDGRIGCYVDENDIAWCNSNWDSNVRSASIETANLRDSSVTPAALDSLIKLVADIAKRNDMGKLVKGKNLTWHSMYTSTSCPGQYLLSKMDYIVDEANKINSVGTDSTSQKEADQILYKGSKVKFDGIFKVDIIKSPVDSNLFGCTQLTGISYDEYYNEKCKDYHWIPTNDFDECDENGNITNQDQIVQGGISFVKNDNIYEVLDIDIPTNSAKLNINGRDVWVYSTYLYEVSNY